jgi:hypothetical protein
MKPQGRGLAVLAALVVMAAGLVACGVTPAGEALGAALPAGLGRAPALEPQVI